MAIQATSLRLVQTTATDEDFRLLVGKLNEELSILYKLDYSFFAQFNKLDSLKQVVVAYLDNIPTGCGAIKPFGEGLAEVKRMFVDLPHRNKGIATLVLMELEKIAKESGCRGCVLETGNKQMDAVALYRKNGYTVIPNYGQYAGVKYSICMKKEW